MNRLLDWIHEHAILSFILAIALLFISCIVFTRPVICEALGFDSSTGVIGDTIGGITAPILGLIGIILVWLTFEAQRNANEQQHQANEQQRLANEQQGIANEYQKVANEHLSIDLDLQFIQALYAEWKEEMADLVKNNPPGSNSVFGVWYQADTDDRSGTYLEQLDGFMISQRILLQRIRASKLSDGYKSVYLTKMTYYYKNHLRPIVILLVRDAPTFIAGKKNDYNSMAFNEIIERITKIENETSPHLTL